MNLTSSANCTTLTSVRRLIPLAFVFAALLVTWPLAPQLATHVPLGSEPAASVPYFNVWTVGWNGMRALDGFRGYWDAPIFYPASGAFAFSDPQPLTGLSGAVLWERSPALAYNLVLLAYLTLNGAVTYAVLRQRGVSTGPAVMGGLLVQWLPFATNERGVLQLQPLFGPIWAIGALWAVLERPSRSRGFSLGAAVGVTALTSEYYALLLVPAFLIALAARLPQFRHSSSWLPLILAAATASAMVMPIALPQAAILQKHGFQRSDLSFARTSAWPADYLRPPSRLRVDALIPEFGLPANQRLYPGAALAGLAVLGGVTAPRSRRRWALFLAAVGLVGFTLSLGSHLRLGNFAPLTLFHQAVPLLRLTRSPFRFAALFQLAAALLAAEGLARLWVRSRLLAVAVATLAILELAPLPERLAEPPSLGAEWAAVVAQVERPVVIHLPWAPDRSASQFAQTTRWMIEALPYEMRLVNGYSGFFPAQHTQLRELMADFPNVEAMQALRGLGADFIVLHGPIDPEQRSQLELLVNDRQLSDERRLDGVSVFGLHATE